MTNAYNCIDESNGNVNRIDVKSEDGLVFLNDLETGGSTFGHFHESFRTRSSFPKQFILLDCPSYPPFSSDDRYMAWPREIQWLLRPSYSLHNIRKNVYNLITVVCKLAFHTCISGRFFLQRIGSSSISMWMSRLTPPLREVSKCYLTCYNWKTWWPHFGLELYSRPKLCWATLKVWYLVRAHNESFKASPLLCTFFFWSDDGDQISCKQVAQLFGALHEKHGKHASVPFLVKKRIMNESGVRNFYDMLICVCVW